MVLNSQFQTVVVVVAAAAVGTVIVEVDYIARDEREKLSVASVTSIPHVGTSVKFMLQTKTYGLAFASSVTSPTQNCMKSADMFKA